MNRREPHLLMNPDNSFPTETPWYRLLLGRGEMGRLRFALWGMGLTFLKWNLDRLFGGWLLGMEGPMEPRALAALYLWQGLPEGIEVRGMRHLLAASVPFLVVGVMFTLGRLRSAGLSGLWVVLFFVPAVKILFFVLLCSLPRRQGGATDGRPRWHRWLPTGPWGAALTAAAISMVIGGGGSWLAVEVSGGYGWALFVGIPFLIGFVSTLLFTAREERSFHACASVTVLSLAMAGACLVAVAMEGVICLLMAAPLAVVIGLVGCLAAWGLRRSWPGQYWSVWPAGLMILAFPGVLGLEGWIPARAPVRPVRTVLEVNAPPEVVWKHVVHFSELPPPDEWLFRMGLAYPIRAEIRGSGPGAVRHCHFSTGPFVEPIEVWDEPRRLAFRVESNPAPMQEWTPYKDVHPPHLEGHFLSRKGEFQLERTAAGSTRLTGTTWYEHRLWPDAYWRLWSDAIIHTIHRRVLRHVARLAEAEIAGEGQGGVVKRAP